MCDPLAGQDYRCPALMAFGEGTDPVTPEQRWNTPDCDGFIDCYTSDRDGDGYGGEGDTVLADALPAGDYCPGSFGVDDDDCGPDDPDIHPGSRVMVLGVDHNCDGRVTCADDGDEDGYGAPFPAYYSTSTDVDCGEPGSSPTDDGDCDDGDAAVHPGAIEAVGDTSDRDCDGRRWCWADADQDGWGSSDAVDIGAERGTCAVPIDHAADRTGDCGPADAGVHPDARELPGNGIDEDCDGLDTFNLSATPSPALPGAPLTLQVRGGRPGRTVWVIYSLSGPGAGPCPPALRGACVGLLSPKLATGTSADATGRVTLDLAAAPPRAWVQAWTLDTTGVGRGTNVLAIP